MVKIKPSIASANQLELKNEIDRIYEYDYLHVDIEDGNFVPNITFGLKTIRAIADVSKADLDAHLLVTNPYIYVNDLLDLGFKEIAFHIEPVLYPADILRKIQKAGAKAGLALNFKTSIKEVLPFVNCLDYVIIMTSEPDDGVFSFSSTMLDKIKAAREFLPKNIEIWTDGGIGEKELKKVVAAGADTVVMGRAVWSSSEPLKVIKTFSEF